MTLRLIDMEKPMPCCDCAYDNFSFMFNSCFACRYEEGDSTYRRPEDCPLGQIEDEEATE